MFAKPTKLPLNQGQKAVAEKFFDFLLDPNATEFNISGPGVLLKKPEKMEIIAYLISGLIDTSSYLT